MATCIAALVATARAAVPTPSVATSIPITLVARPAEPGPAASSATPEAGALTGSGVLLVTVSDIDSRSLGDDQLLSSLPRPALRTEGLPEVKFGQPAPLPAGVGVRQWAVPFDVRGMAPASTVTLYATVTVARTTWNLPFQVTSPAATPATTWSFKGWPPGGRAYDAVMGLPVSIGISGSTPLKELRVASVDLVEQSTRESTSLRGWKLCALDDLRCSRDTQANLRSGVHALRVVPPEGAELGPGKYDAVLVLAGSGKADGADTVTTLLYATTMGWQLGGFALVMVGLMLSLGVTTFTRRWIDRNRLMMPAAVVQQSFVRLQRVLAAITDRPAMDRLDKQLQACLQRLGLRKLEDNGLPGKVPLPWTALTEAGLEQLKKYVELVAADSRALQVIVEDGVQRVESLKRPGCDAARRQAYTEFDELAAALPADPVELKSRIDEIVGAFVQSCVPTLEAAATDAVTAPSRAMALPSPAQLQLRIQRGSLLVWLFVSVVTVATGTYLLVLTNPGFGTTTDLLACLFWGLGISTATAAAGVTVNSVVSTFSVLR